MGSEALMHKLNYESKVPESSCDICSRVPTSEELLVTRRGFAGLFMCSQCVEKPTERIREELNRNEHKRESKTIENLEAKHIQPNNGFTCVQGESETTNFLVESEEQIKMRQRRERDENEKVAKDLIFSVICIDLICVETR